MAVSSDCVPSLCSLKILLAVALAAPLLGTAMFDEDLRCLAESGLWDALKGLFFSADLLAGSTKRCACSSAS